MSEARRVRGAVAERHGRDAEQYIAEMLLNEGCEILARRKKTPHGEIDLIAADTVYIVFVEIKRRPTLHQAAISLSSRQSMRLLKAAAYCLDTEASWRRENTRFDLIIIDQQKAVRRIKDIMRDD